MNTDPILYEQGNYYGMHNQALTLQYHDDELDETYWCQRVRNNLSTENSRIQRQSLEKDIEKILALENENMQIRNQLAAFHRDELYLRRIKESQCASIIKTDGTKTQDKKDRTVMMEECDDGDNNLSDVNIHELPSSTSSPSLEDESESISPETQSYLSILDKGKSINVCGDISSISVGKSEIEDYLGESPLLHDSFVASSYNSVSSISSFYNKQINGEMEVIKHPETQSKAMRIHDSPTSKYLSLPLKAEAVMRMAKCPCSLLNISGNADSSPKTWIKESIQKIPHKFRIKEKLHSAYTTRMPVDRIDLTAKEKYLRP